VLADVASLVAMAPGLTSVGMQLVAAAQPGAEPRRPVAGPTSFWPLHVAAALGTAALLAVLLCQLVCACARPAGGRLARAKPSAPLLPTTVALAADAPFVVHWSTLAVAEVFVAAYVACWSITPLPWAQRLAVLSASLLCSAATYRAVRMALWGCGALPHAAVVAPAKPGGAASAKAPSSKALGKAPANGCVRACARLWETLQRAIKLPGAAKATSGSKAPTGRRPAAGGPSRATAAKQPPKGKPTPGGKRALL
jgi:hypothetical protein